MCLEVNTKFVIHSNACPLGLAESIDCQDLENDWIRDWHPADYKLYPSTQLDESDLGVLRLQGRVGRWHPWSLSSDDVTSPSQHYQ